MPLYQTDGPKGDHAIDLQGQNQQQIPYMHFNSSSALEVQIISHDDTFLSRSVVTLLATGCPYLGQKRKKNVQGSINCCPSAFPETFLNLFLQRNLRYKVPWGRLEGSVTTTSMPES